MALKIFVDSDVIISSLISQTGAAFLLLNQTDDLDLFIATKSQQELQEVVKRLNLYQDKLKNLISRRFSVIQLNEPLNKLKKQFADYVLDDNDAHIVAGAKAAPARFLISYNTRHCKTDRLKKDFNIILTTPANLLQYLRSQ